MGQEEDVVIDVKVNQPELQQVLFCISLQKTDIAYMLGLTVYKVG